MSRPWDPSQNVSSNFTWVSGTRLISREPLVKARPPPGADPSSTQLMPSSSAWQGPPLFLLALHPVSTVSLLERSQIRLFKKQMSG